MKKSLFVALMLMVGCGTSQPHSIQWSRTRTADGKVFFGPRYRGEGVYLVSMASDGLSSDSIVVRPKKGVIEFEVGLLNGYDRDVFLKAEICSCQLRVNRENGKASLAVSSIASSCPTRYFGSYDLVKPSYYRKEQSFLRFGDFVRPFTVRHHLNEDRPRLSSPGEARDIEMTFGLRILYSVVGDSRILKGNVRVPVTVLPERVLTTE